MRVCLICRHRYPSYRMRGMLQYRWNIEQHKRRRRGEARRYLTDCTRPPPLPIDRFGERRWFFIITGALLRLVFWCLLAVRTRTIKNCITQRIPRTSPAAAAARSFSHQRPTPLDSGEGVVDAVAATGVRQTPTAKTAERISHAESFDYGHGHDPHGEAQIRKFCEGLESLAAEYEHQSRHINHLSK